MRAGHTYQRTSPAGTTLEQAERMAIKGAVCGIWLGQRQKHDTILRLPGVDVAQAMELAVYAERDARIGDCSVKAEVAASGSVLLLTVRHRR